MDKITKERVCAEADGDIVVFLIGMRINKIWKVWTWLPVMRAMGRMLRELQAQPQLGLLATAPYLSGRVIGITQYWASIEQLHTYAHSQAFLHQPAWRDFNARVGSNGDVGIWHETYAVPAGASESIYVNMPKFGLGRAGALYPARGERASATKRLSRRAGPASA